MVQLSSTEKLQTVCTIWFLMSCIHMPFHVLLQVPLPVAVVGTNMTGIVFDFEVNHHLMLFQVPLPLTLEATVRMIACKGSSFLVIDSCVFSQVAGK